MSNTEIQFIENGKVKDIILDPSLPALHKEEVVLWSHTAEKGIIKKTPMWRWVITNFRVFDYDEEEQIMHRHLLIRDLDDVIVMDPQQTSESSGYGSFNGFAVGFSNTKSKTIGDISFLKNGKILVTFGGISDPYGVADMVKSIKKQSYKEIEKNNDDPLTILKKRLAKGEITKAEYEDLKSALE